MALEFRLNRTDPTTADADCIVVGLYADGSLPPSAQAVDRASGGRLAALAERGDVSGKTGRTTLLPDLAGVKSPRVLVVGLGDAGKFGVPQYLKAVADAVRALKTGPAGHALLTLTELTVPGRDAGGDRLALGEGGGVLAGDRQLAQAGFVDLLAAALAERSGVAVA
ncbi:MAG TPA: M17 family peptidase N-terminal domain-containing protein, partial [Arenimonas sp.]|nr:M17 family peptidase N-terminal domain-containing protein [Arenimonas sp.]